MVGDVHVATGRPAASMFSYTFRMQHTPELRIFATLGGGPEIGLVLV